MILISQGDRDSLLVKWCKQNPTVLELGHVFLHMLAYILRLLCLQFLDLVKKKILQVFCFYLSFVWAGLHCFVQAFSSYREQGLLLVAVHWFLIAVFLLLQSMGSRCTGFSICGAGAYLLWDMWDLPWPGIKPMYPALAGRFLSTA